jgi:hypothetical protein
VHAVEVFGEAARCDATIVMHTALLIAADVKTLCERTFVDRLEG